MVEHLHDKVKKILKMASPRKGDIVIDIGSNDGTTLRAYPADMATLVGFDPTESNSGLIIRSTYN